MIKINIVRDLGLMEIDVLYPDKEIAERINRAVVGVLSDNHQFYHGAGNAITIRILDYPAVSEKPVTTELYLVTVLGAVAGLLVGLGWTLRKVL